MELQFCQSIANYNIGRFTTRKKEACSMLDVANRFLRKCVGDVWAMLLGCVGMRCNGANSRPEWNQNASRMKPKGSPKRSKMEPKVIQNGTKRDQDTAKGSVVKKNDFYMKKGAHRGTIWHHFSAPLRRKSIKKQSPKSSQQPVSKIIGKASQKYPKLEPKSMPKPIKILCPKRYQKNEGNH